MPDHQPLTTSLTLTAGEFAPRHEQVLYDGGRTVGEYRDPCGRGALADLVAWLPDLTAEAYADPFLPRSPPPLAAARAGVADAAPPHDDQPEAAGARARAAELARVRLAAYAARPDA